MRVVVRGVHPEQTRWVTPFPNDYPDFRVEVKDIPKEEQAKIARRYGMTPHKPEARDYETAIAYTRDLFKAQFVGAQGEASFFGEELGDNREPYIDSEVLREGEEGDPDRPPCSKCGEIDKAIVGERLWLYIGRLAQKERTKEIKN